MSRLRKVPYFTSAYEPDGIAPPDFNKMPALLSTMKQFRGAMDKIVSFTDETLRSLRLEMTPT
jgi:hypothetical protein